MRRVRLFTLLCVVAVSGCASQTASYHYVQKQIEQGDLGFHRSIRVDEYLNAFPQDWFTVQAGQDIALRVDPLTTGPVKTGETALYQIAVKTRLPSREEARTPLGLALVIDVSGSMNDDRKIIHTREALRNSILELKDGDVVSLVIFNEAARVISSNVLLSPATRSQLVEQVAGLRAGGGTNIEDGLVVGYREMAKFPAGNIKRLILLTDGQSNIGAVTPEQIAKEAAVRRVEGARISTIGLGIDVNERLLRQIADAGQGHYYFAENAQTLTKILRDGLQTTVVPVAKDVALDVELGEPFVLERIHGAGPENRAGKRSAHVALGELNVNDWRILVVELKRETGAGTPDVLHVTGQYAPIGGGGPRPIPQARGAGPVSTDKINPFVLRNAVLYANAQALVEAGRLSEQKRYEDALRVLDVQINNNDVLAELDDSEMVRKERDNLARVRSLIAARVDGGAKQAVSASPATPPTAGSKDKAVRALIAAGLKGSAVALPGLWSTIALVLAAVIE